MSRECTSKRGGVDLELQLLLQQRTCSPTLSLMAVVHDQPNPMGDSADTMALWVAGRSERGGGSRTHCLLARRTA